MKYRVALIVLTTIFTACSASLTTEDFRAMRTQVEYVDDIIMGNFDLSRGEVQWTDIMGYLSIHEPATHKMFEKYEVEFFVNDGSYLLLLRHPYNRHIIMYDYSCTSGKLDGPLFETKSRGTLRDIIAPECAEDKCFIR